MRIIEHQTINKDEHLYHGSDIEIALSCTVVCFPYLPDSNCFMYDPIPTHFMFHHDSDVNKGSYSYWLLHEGMELSQYCDFSQDEHNRYTNEYWDNSRNAIADILYNYMYALWSMIRYLKILFLLLLQNRNRK